MFHIIQSFSRASSKMLRLGASKMGTLSFKIALQQKLSPLFPRPQLFQSFPGCLSKNQCYHTSPCSFKKKEKQTVAKPPSTITYLTDSPKPALYLTLAGLIPLVAPPVVMVMTKTYIPGLAFSQMVYGASFLSFLGGIRWGFSLPEGSPAKPDYLNLASSLIPVVFSWFAFLISEGLGEAIVTIVIGLGIALHVEVFILPQYPNWFKACRIVITLVAFFSYVATLVVQNIYPEKEHKSLH
ncbi:transmembrane protein 69 [Perognathus longimembris pacificus]|uniref:transmembrane protein 69 n=1 Tax=Perognathus longimembris pacificus TaxID=214514 RepID=UPI00201970A8|nr:transmembrane protein 69 [Perognathus longimembris pacificus]XP_048207161.1 transmembrane protein 69 [Perognathus longimembris pacificus]XP_048207162.1 transmembrane protein 69 [Perognathus longimembris pacificus]